MRGRCLPRQCHNRKVCRRYGPGRSWWLEPRGRDALSGTQARSVRLAGLAARWAGAGAQAEAPRRIVTHHHCSKQVHAPPPIPLHLTRRAQPPPPPPAGHLTTSLSLLLHQVFPLLNGFAFILLLLLFTYTNTQQHTMDEEYDVSSYHHDHHLGNVTLSRSRATPGGWWLPPSNWFRIAC